MEADISHGLAALVCALPSAVPDWGACGFTGLQRRSAASAGDLPEAPAVLSSTCTLASAWAWPAVLLGGAGAVLAACWLLGLPAAVSGSRDADAGLLGPCCWGRCAWDCCACGLQATECTQSSCPSSSASSSATMACSPMLKRSCGAYLHKRARLSGRGGDRAPSRVHSCRAGTRVAAQPRLWRLSSTQRCVSSETHSSRWATWHKGMRAASPQLLRGELHLAKAGSAGVVAAGLTGWQAAARTLQMRTCLSCEPVASSMRSPATQEASSDVQGGTRALHIPTGWQVRTLVTLEAAAPAEVAPAITQSSAAQLREVADMLHLPPCAAEDHLR